MTVAFDTNVILDAAMGRNDYESAQALVQAVLSEDVTGVVTANTITDIHYIIKKRAGDKAAREVVQNTLDIFEIAPVNGEMCAEALNLGMDDFEDAVLAVSADTVGARYIATGDKGFIGSAESPVPALHPKDVLARIREAGE